jgi:biopolymer transport protein TolR
MAGGMDLGNSGKGGKKPLDAAINLVPFIDLMAVTISFLIMTAVWTQIGRLQVTNGGGGDVSPESASLVPVVLSMSDREFRFSVGSKVFEPIPVVRDGEGRMDVLKLRGHLKDVKAQLPNQSNISVTAEDSVRYEDLVRIIDECIGNGLPNVSVQAATG